MTLLANFVGSKGRQGILMTKTSLEFVFSVPRRNMNIKMHILPTWHTHWTRCWRHIHEFKLPGESWHQSPVNSWTLWAPEGVELERKITSTGLKNRGSQLFWREMLFYFLWSLNLRKKRSKRVQGREVPRF